MDRLTNADVIAIARRHRDEMGSILQHHVDWKVDRWRRALPDEGWVTSTLEELHAEDRHHISRAQVSRFALNPMQLFVASNIWGYGPIGYGPSRVAAIIANNRTHLNESLSGIARAALVGPGNAWDTLAGMHRIRGFGVAFGTKFAYFASLVDPSLDRRPLIADLNTSWALWRVAEVPRSLEIRERYLDYIEYAHRPEFEGFAPDEIEWALFELGKTIERPTSTRRIVERRL